jgi:hypothetical protein
LADGSLLSGVHKVDEGALQHHIREGTNVAGEFRVEVEEDEVLVKETPICAR